VQDLSLFLISGYFALNEKIVSLKKYYYNRVVTIVIPFLFYAYIHYFMVHYDFGRAANALSGFFSITTLADFLHAVIIGPAFNGSMFVSLHFWFIYWIVGAYAVVPFVGYVIQRIEPSSRLKSIAFLLGVSWLHLYVNRYFPNANIISIPFIADGWFVYFLIGGLLYGLELNKYRKYAFVCCAIGYVLTVFLTWFNFSMLSIYQAPYGIDINMVLCVCGFFIIFKRFAKVFNDVGCESIEIHLWDLFDSCIYDVFCKRLYENGYEQCYCKFCVDGCGCFYTGVNFLLHFR
jgi:surface polysaccharide O-acyltransferase-like enzyme